MRGVKVLNYSAYDNAIFIDRGLVSVVTIEEAYNLWDKWLAGYQQKHLD